MAKDISASVGRLGGVNRPADVKTVQQLLNNVPAHSGGPVPSLDPDGKCGPKTIAAIQNFQLKHFGWKGADGRVDPNGPTHTLLNIFDAPAIPVPPAVTPQPQANPTSTKFVIHRMGSATSFDTRDENLFFQVFDMTNGLVGDYWLQPSGRQMTAQKPPEKFSGASRSFTPKAAHAVDKLGCEAMYASREKSGQVTSSMTLFLPSGGVRIDDMPHHLIGPNGMVKPSKGETSVAIAGTLRFVKMG
jgi:peptidoglycan hydrolase-like protein with peptidoglycan-binding domain